MTAEDLALHVRSSIERCAVMTSARGDVVRAIDALDPRYFRLVSELLGTRSGELAMARALSVIFLIAMVQLADDLSDGDCTYLHDPARRGPVVQALLHTLALRQLLKTGLSPERIGELLDELLEVGAAQHDELTRTTWDLTSYLALAERINGRQLAVYFSILLEEPGDDQRAHGVGFAFGMSLHVVSDAQSADRRWSSLPPDAQHVAALTATICAERALAARMPALEPHALYLHGYATVLAAKAAGTPRE